ncbi:hypothetical protein PybrP1_007403 [[Pythium] brassicae (nom. inval.)]|nr:hypothetical protein PybrP1_007403 [[Pythium] brassicae (nom. inval.)]
MDGLTDFACVGTGRLVVALRVRSPAVSACLEDDDGDLVVPRRRQRKRRHCDSDPGSDSEEVAAYTLESSGEAAEWDAAGSQLWRAALLLADFVHANLVRVGCKRSTSAMGVWHCSGPDCVLCAEGAVSRKNHRGARLRDRCVWVCLRRGECACGRATSADSNVFATLWAQASRRWSRPGRQTGAGADPVVALTGTSIQRNVRVRQFDWDAELAGSESAASATPIAFCWSQDDREALHARSPTGTRALGGGGLTICSPPTRLLAASPAALLPSDVFYDDETTVAFLTALHRLMRQNPRLTAVVALEKRVVFSAVTLSAISLGFDAFQAHMCSHDAATSHHDVGFANQVVCHACNADTKEHDEQEGQTCHPLKFVVRTVPLDHIPHAFAYQRVSTLMLWVIEKVVVAPALPVTTKSG